MAKAANKNSTRIVGKTEQQLKDEIIHESKMLALNKTTSCYNLIMKTKELIKLDKVSGQ